MPLPNMRIGTQDAERVDWRTAKLQDAPDDDAPRPADKDVIEMLGFDPAELDDDSEGDDDGEPPLASDEWDESAHERDESGKFAAGGGKAKAIKNDDGFLNAEETLRATPDRILSESDGVRISKKNGSIIAEVDGEKVGEMSLSWRAPYATHVEVKPGARRKGIAASMYAAAEEQLGRRMMPSPLGLSDDAMKFWKRRLADMPEEDKQALLREAVAVGKSAGVPKAATERMEKLGLALDEWNEAAHKRGQPGNAGQFASGGGSSAPASEGSEA